MLYDGVNSPFVQTNGTMTLSGGTVINVNIPGPILGAGNHTIIAAATLGNVGQVTGSLPSVNITGSGTVGAASLVINGSGGLDLVVTAPAIWTGATDNTWITGGNWLAATEPAAADSILFNSSSTANLSITQNDPSGGVQWGVSVVDPTGPVTIGGPNSLTTYGGGLNLSSASQNLTVSAPLVINADQNWLVTNSRTLTISGPVSTVSGGNVTINGGGKVQMGAAHVLDGLTTASPGAGDFTVGISGTLDFNGNSQAMNGLNGVAGGVVDNTGAGAATILVNSNADNSTFNGVIQNSGGALALDVFLGRLTLNSSSNTYSGGTTFESGSFLYFPSATAKYGTGPVTFKPGANSYTSANTFTNVLSLDSCYLRVGGGNLNVQNWSGPITITNGFQMSGDGGAGGITLSGPINIGTGGLSITNTGVNGPTQGFNVSTTGDLLSGAMSGSGGVTYYCNGSSSRLTVRGANTYSGNTVVNGTGNGKLNVNGGGNPFSTGSVTLNPGAVIEAAPGSQTVTNALTLNGAILESECQFNNFNTLTWAGPVTLTADSALFQQGTKNSTGTGDNQSSGVNISGPLNVNGFTLGCYGNFSFFGGHTLSGQVSGAGNIQVTNNTLAVSGSNTFTGTFRAVGGTLSAGNTYAFQNSTLDLNAADAGTFNMNNRDLVIGAVTGSRNLSLGSGKVSIGNNNVTTLFTGTLSGLGTLTKIGSGTLSVSNNAYNGSVVVSNGTLVLAQPTLTNSALVAVSVAGGSFLKLDFDATNVVANLVLNGVGQPAGIYKAANSGGRITGIGAIQVAPPQVWLGTSSTSWNTSGNWANGIIPGAGSNAIFNASSAANLATVLNANFNLATLQLANPSGPVSIAAGGANTLSLTNGIDMSKATQPLTITAPVALGAAQTWNVASNITLSANGAVSGSAALTVTGGGTVSLAGTNTYTGATTVSAGTLIMAGQNATASVTISAATNAPKVLATTNGALGSGTVTIGGGTSIGSTLQVQGGITLNNAITLQARQTTTGANAVGIENVSGNNTLGGTIAALAAGGNQWVVQSDAGTLTLGTAGSTWISSSTGARGPTFQGAGNFSVVGNIVNGAGTAQAFMTGAGTLTLSGANSYSSGFTLSSGALNIQSATALGGAASIFTIAGTSTIDTSAAGVTISANNTNAWNADFTFAGTGNLNLGSGPVTLSSNRQVTVSAKTLTVGGVISGAFPLTKAGAGSLVLSGASSYSGGTILSAGSLLVNNSTGTGTGTGSVIISSGSTLGGTGIIGGPTTNNAGGILSPGVAGIGALTFTNILALQSGSTNTFVVNGTTGVASNSVVLGAGVTYGGVLNIVTNGTFTGGQTFQLFSGAGATNASNFASIVGSPGAGKAFSFTNGVLSVVTTVLPKAVINSVTVNGSNLILQGTNGAASGTYSILTSTNLDVPLANWTTNSTGSFTAGGAFSNGVPITSQAQRYFLIKQP
jgi:autotransporter-associated beta strand protein